MDGEQDQRLVAGGRKKAGDQHIGIDHRPDHLTPPGVTGHQGDARRESGSQLTRRWTEVDSNPRSHLRHHRLEIALVI